MRAQPTDLHGVLIVEPQLFQDQRGWFFETYSRPKMEAIGIRDIFVQDNHSYSRFKGTVRGIHFQNEPMAQAKLVRCTRGSITDVAVDLRKGSPYYCKHIKVELSAENMRMLYIPRGFGHGFVTLTDEVEVQYKVDNVYSKEHDRSIRYDDKAIDVDWSVAEPLLSDKDLKAPPLSGSDCNFHF